MALALATLCVLVVTSLAVSLLLVCAGACCAAAADWRRLDAEARHVFTHFSLNLTIFVATAEEACRPARGFFVPRARAQVGKTPTAFAKALRLTLPELGL